MRGGFDLRGRYYTSVEDAINAELSQMSEIDTAHNRRQIQNIERDLRHRQERQRYDEQIMYEEIKRLRDRVSILEFQLIRMSRKRNHHRKTRKHGK